MSKQLIIGFCTEGSTDCRFLESVIQRTFEEIAFECQGQIDILPIQFLEKETGTFLEVVEQYAKKSYEYGIMVLCIHADADADTEKICLDNKIIPAFQSVINTSDSSICKELVAVIPVQMTEAWMLADTNLLKREIGTDKSDVDLGLHRNPEQIANPKATIKEAIRIAKLNAPKKRRKELIISELYLSIGQKVDLTSLDSLPSYQKFKTNVRLAFENLNYLH